MRNSDSSRTLGTAARDALLWGAGFTLARDVLQFTTMLVLVRFLTPREYGTAALAQTILGLVSIVSFKVLLSHALQARDPASIDWQAHFTAAATVNSALAIVVIAIAGFLGTTEKYSEVALPLAAMSLALLVEVPASLRHTMVQVAHDWARFRVLTFAGAVLGSVVAIAVAIGGGGVWALVLPVVLFGVPAIVDLFIFLKWRPTWTWSWERYRHVARFGAGRIVAGAGPAARQMVEQAAIASAFSLSSLGVFTRTVGLATLAAGRVGSVVSSSLYPVVTRAPAQSTQFARIGGLVFRGVAWITFPAAALLACIADDAVKLLYGSQWLEVIPILPLAAAYVGLTSASATAYSLLLANERVRLCLAIDVTAAVAGIIVALVAIPLGTHVYLMALVIYAAVLLVVSTAMLRASNGISLGALIYAIFPPAVACGMASMAVLGLRAILHPHPINNLPLRLGVDVLIFTVAFSIVIRILFARSLVELLAFAPGGRHIARMLRV